MWKVGDQIGPVGQMHEPQVLLPWGTVKAVHDNGLTVDWPGETKRYYFTDGGLRVQRRAACQK